MVRVPRTSFFHIKEWIHITGSEQTFYRPIDIALLWLGEVIVRKEFLTVFMDMLNFTWGFERQADMLSGRPCAEWERPVDLSDSVFLFRVLIYSDSWQSTTFRSWTVNLMPNLNSTSFCYWWIGEYPICAPSIQYCIIFHVKPILY